MTHELCLSTNRNFIKVLSFIVLFLTSGLLLADERDTLLLSGRAAMEDGIYELAQTDFSKWLEGATVRDLQNKEVMVLFLRSLYEQHKYADILTSLDRFSKKFKIIKDSDIENYWRSLALYELGKYDQALKGIEDYEKRYPDSSDYLRRVTLLRSWCYLASADTEKALKLFEEFDKKYGSSMEASANLLLWAKTLVQNKQMDKALPLLSRLSDFKKDDKYVRQGQYLLAQLLLEADKKDQASTVLTGLCSNVNASVDLRAESWFSIADILADGTNKVLALTAVEDGVALAHDPKIKRKGNVMLGRMLLKGNTLTNGVTVLKQLIAEAPEDPESGDLQIELAEALLNNGSNTAAVVEFQNYFDSFTNVSGRVYFGRGWALFNSERYPEAVTDFMKAYELFQQGSDKEKSLFKAADSYFASASYKLSAKTYKRVIDEFPDTDLIPNAMFQLAECFSRLGEIEKAESDFLSLSKKYPKSPMGEEALLRIAEIKAQLASEGSSRALLFKAVEAFSNVMDSFPNGKFFADALHGRGMVYFNLYRFRDAMTDFERVVKDFPKSDMAERSYYKLGMCYYWLANDEKALLTWRDFLKTYPSSKWASKVLFEIAKCEYNTEAYADAEKQFLAFAKEYSKDKLADDALLRAGRSAMLLKEYRRSVETFGMIVKDYPKSEKISEARFYQAGALYQLGEYSSAILILQELVTKYPQSDLIPEVYMLKGDSQFTLGAEDKKRYEEAISSYKVVANNSSAEYALIIQAEYKIGRCLEKLDRTSDAFEYYYSKVMVRFLDDRSKGVFQDEESLTFFIRASNNAADIMEVRKDWRAVVKILERLVDVGVPGVDEIKTRIRKIRSEHWSFFY